MDGSTSKGEGSGAVPLLRVLLIDLENCPSHLQHLASELAEYRRVVVCYAQSHSVVPVDWLVPLSAAITAGKLQIIKMERVGKNAADFGICFFAGALMQEFPRETHFVIVSNDADLDHAVHLLQSQGRSAERIGRKEDREQKEATAPASTLSVKPTSEARFCAQLLKMGTARPGKKQTLLNSISNLFKEGPSLSVPVLEELMARGVVKLTGTKVTYDDRLLRVLAENA